MHTRLIIPTDFSDYELDAELVDVRRDNHDLVEWSDGFGPAAKLSVYFTLIVEGTSLISGPDWEYKLGPGDGLLVLSGETIRAVFEGNKFLRSYNLHFQLKGIPNDDLLSIFPRTVGPEDNTARMRDLLDGLIDANRRHIDNLAALELSGFLSELAKLPIRRQAKNLSQVVRRALDFISKHCRENPGRTEVADAVQVTPNHLSAIVKSETGKTLGQHVNVARVRLAKDLMYTERLNVSETADRLGMDIHSFSRLFKSVTGKSPAQHKRETLTGTPDLTPDGSS